MSNLKDLVVYWVENTDSKRKRPAHEKSIRYNIDDVFYFSDEKLIGVNAICSRWDKIVGLTGNDIFNFLWESGEVNVYRRIDRAINQSVPEETMYGFVPLSAIYMHDSVWAGPAKLLIHQVLSVEKKYPELALSAQKNLEARAMAGSDIKSYERAYNTEMRASFDPVLQTLGDMGTLSATSLYKFFNDFGAVFPDKELIPDSIQLKKLSSFIEKMGYQTPELVRKRTDALERLRNVIKNSSDLPENVTPESILSGDYPLSSAIENSPQFAEYCKVDRELCFLIMLSRFFETHLNLASLKISLALKSEGNDDPDQLESALLERNAQIADLERQLSIATDIMNKNRGLAGKVCDMRREGKSDEEIAAYLYDGGTWCTQAQIGALLHADDSRVASESMQQRARRLLGKA